MKIRPCLLGTLAVLAACAGSRSRGAWDAPPRETPGANQADQRDEATPDTTSGGTVVESLDAWPQSAPTQSETPAIAPPEPTEPSVAVAEPPPTGTRTEEPDSPAPIRSPDKEVSLHPDAPVPDLVTLLEMQLDAAPVDRTSKGWRTRVPPPPDVPLETRRNYFWLLETDVGPLNIRLFPKTAPRHVLSVAWLTQLGFYDGLPFHRILSGAIAQSGDPVGDGSGGPGYRLDGEFPAKGPSFDREGLIGFANAGPNSDGSQFFITFGPLPHLDGKHTIVGETVGNSRPLRALMSLATKSGRPREPVKIKRAEIVIR